MKLEGILTEMGKAELENVDRMDAKRALDFDQSSIDVRFCLERTLKNPRKVSNVKSEGLMPCVYLYRWCIVRD